MKNLNLEVIEKFRVGNSMIDVLRLIAVNLITPKTVLKVLLFNIVISAEKYHFSALFLLVGKVGRYVVHSLDKKLTDFAFPNKTFVFHRW